MSIVIIGKVLEKRWPTATWVTNNSLLDDGEIGLDTTINNFKVGPGNWNDLDYWIVSSSLSDIEFDFLAGADTDLHYLDVPDVPAIPDVTAKGIFIYAEQYYTDGTYGSTLIPYALFVQKIIYDNDILFRKSDPGDSIRITIQR